MFQQPPSLRVLRLAALLVLATAHPMSANAEIILSPSGRFFSDFGVLLPGPHNYTGDFSLEPTGFALLLQSAAQDSILTVNGGSTLLSPRGLGTYFPILVDLDSARRADFVVDGVGSRIVIGGGTVGTGNIVLQGKGDFLIANGGSVSWAEPNSCSGAFQDCDVLIGANNEPNNLSGITNIGIVVEGPGSLLDASNTNGGRLFVGFTLAQSPVGQSEDFLVALDGGEIRSNGADIAKGWDQPGTWDPDLNGFLTGISVIDNGTWSIQGDNGGSSNINIGEGDGASGLLAVTNGGVVEITGNPGADAGFFLGQSAEGTPTQGGENLLFVSGIGSRLSVDNNLNVFSGSRIANGAVSIQEQGALDLDSSILLISGRDGMVASSFFPLIENALAVTNLVPTSQALAVVSNGSLTITDVDSICISALIIGQTPDAGPTQEAHVFVDGTITVINDPNAPKILLNTSEFGIPVVSNIGTGSLEIADSGVVEFQNGDFVIGVGLSDMAEVTVRDGGQLTAERVVIGWADLEGGPGIGPAKTGELILSDGIVNGDVYVDDNGALSGFGIVNGTIFVDGGMVAPGFSPGTITAESFFLGPDSELVMQVSLNPDGTVNPAGSDSIVVTTDTLDLSAGSVTFQLSSTDELVYPLKTILSTTEPVLSVSEFFESPDEVIVVDYNLTVDPEVPLTEPILEEELEQSVVVVSFEKGECKNDGWMSLTRSDESAFVEQGDCNQYANTGK
jgi:hypothetical protein